MLFSTYSNNLEELVEPSEKLTEPQIKLLTFLRSQGGFEQLMDVLPEGWENTFKINFYDHPAEVARAFRNETHYKNSRTIYEHTVLSVIITKQLDVDPATGESHLKYPAVPSSYDEYYKRDYDDYPDDETKWKLNQESTTLTHGSFHLDHKLIWTMKQREVDINSSDNIESVPYTYSINVYVPTVETLIAVENLKRNGVL